MEENIFYALPGFDRMLEQKTFEALSSQEKKLVLKFISKEEYNSFREAVLVSQHRKFNVEPPIVPDPLVKTRLMQTLGPAEKSLPASPVGTLSSFLKYSIPLYQAGLAASVLLFFVFYLFLHTYHMPGQVAVTDTVYVDKPILLRDTVWLEKPAVKSPGREMTHHRRTNTRNTTAAQSLPENSLYASQMQDAMSRISVISGLSKDKSVNHDAGLMKLVTTGCFFNH
jgi:hypothetical protein